MVTATKVQILVEAVCTSHSANTLHPAMVKIVGQNELFNLGIAINLDGKLLIQIC